jgi:hypothetical protein
MEIRTMADALRDYWAVFLAVIVFVTPIIWYGASLYYGGRIEALKEQLNLVREQKQFLEAKLKAPPEFPVSASPNAATGESTASSRPPVDAGGVRYPPINNPRQLTKAEVRDLAKFYGLFTEWKVNPGLRFSDGDVSYWYEQGLSEEGLKWQFESRRIVLQRAEMTGEKIETQGDLSHKAQAIKP